MSKLLLDFTVEGAKHINLVAQGSVIHLFYMIAPTLTIKARLLYKWVLGVLEFS